jgi:P-type conjugative transfer protein TrbJ
MSIKENMRVVAIGVALAIGAAAVTLPQSASAQWAVFDPTNYVQNYLQQLRAVQSNLNEVRQLQQQLQQLQNMAENTKGLTQGHWDMSSRSIDRLVGVLEAGEGLAVSGKNFESQFKTMFPGYKPDRNYSQQYDRWNRTTRDSVLGAMKVANMQVNGIQSEAQALNMLRSAAQSTTGQKQALDAANQIALASIDQLQQLRELMAAQTQIAGVQAAAAAQAEEARRNVGKDMLKAPEKQRSTGARKACAVPPCG